MAFGKICTDLTIKSFEVIVCRSKLRPPGILKHDRVESRQFILALDLRVLIFSGLLTINLFDIQSNGGGKFLMTMKLGVVPIEGMRVKGFALMKDGLKWAP